MTRRRSLRPIRSCDRENAVGTRATRSPAQHARRDRSADERHERDRRDVLRGDEQKRILGTVDGVERGGHAAGEQPCHATAGARPARGAVT
jgi:hypothetical protein